jgi:hypothetical protein
MQLDALRSAWLAWLTPHGASARAAFQKLTDEVIPATARDFETEFQRAAGADVDVSAFLHGRGVNLRYIPEVAGHCRTNAAAREFLLQEALIRAAKHKIRSLWAQSARSLEHAVELTEDAIARLRNGQLWDQVPFAMSTSTAVELPPSAVWPWEARLRRAIGVPSVPGQASPLPASKLVNPPRRFGSSRILTFTIRERGGEVAKPQLGYILAPAVAAAPSGASSPYVDFGIAAPGQNTGAPAPAAAALSAGDSPYILFAKK